MDSPIPQKVREATGRVGCKCQPTKHLREPRRRGGDSFRTRSRPAVIRPLVGAFIVGAGWQESPTNGPRSTKFPRRVEMIGSRKTVAICRVQLVCRNCLFRRFRRFQSVGSLARKHRQQRKASPHDSPVRAAENSPGRRSGSPGLARPCPGLFSFARTGLLGFGPFSSSDTASSTELPTESPEIPRSNTDSNSKQRNSASIIDWKSQQNLSGTQNQRKIKFSTPPPLLFRQNLVR